MQTKLIRSTYNIVPEQMGGVLTIGNFDGVHLGHQHLVKSVVEKAHTWNVPSTVITFEPHPYEFFSKSIVTVPRLSRLREKYTDLANLKVDNILVLPFNQILANKSASDFITEINTSLKPKHIIIGDDFRFGNKRQGDFALLQTMGEALGFTVEAMPTFFLDGERVSSTRVRKALAAGDHELADRLLGHRYCMLGKVRPGDQLGRKWGFPTANLYLHRKLTPVSGVYIVYMHGIDKKPLPGVANVGIRPTVDGTKPLLEVHLLDFNQQIYGRYVKVEFCQKLREEIRYPAVELLKEQIAKDVEMARSYFKKQGVL